MSAAAATPTGLNLHPPKPDTVRLSKKAGIVALSVGGVVFLAFGYGLFDRQRRQEAAARASTKPDATHMTAAMDAAKQVTLSMRNDSSTAARESASKTEELQPPLKVARTLSSGRGGYQGSPMPSGAPQTMNPPPPPGRQELTPEERRLELARQRELEAMDAPTKTRSGASGRMPGALSESGQGGQSGDLLTGLVNAMAGSPKGAGGNGNAVTANAAGGTRISLFPNAAEEYASQNNQERKEDFLARARQSTKENNYLGSTRSAPLGRYEIKAGWDIPAVLEQAVNSDLPGDVRALVRENVYDTASGNYLLIPQGARLVGIYSSQISYGQSAIQVVWNRIIYPDGTSINLEGMVGQDDRGNAGFRHTVDNHYKRLLGWGLLTSAFSGAFYLSQNRRANFLTQPNAGELLGSAAGNELSQLGSQVTRRNLNIQPTIKIPLGYRFNVRVNRDMLFEGPYKPLRL